MEYKEYKEYKGDEIEKIYSFWREIFCSNF